MQIITLTTDVGLKDFYVAAVKGTLFTKLKNVQIVDVSHEIKPFDVAEAAYQLRNCFDAFPEGTLHLVGVDSEPVFSSSLDANFEFITKSLPMVVVFKKQFIVVNDNGFIGTFLGEDEADALYRYDQIEIPKDHWTFMMKTCFIDIATRLVSGHELSSFCTETSSYKKAFMQNPTIEYNLIQGNVIHIDTYGNIITNILRSDFERFGSETPFKISYQKRAYDIDVISNAYSEVPVGERVAIFNHNNRLEIAINRGANKGNGGADQLFGVRLGEVVRVTFYPKGSVDTLTSLL
ncbi:MAG: S-adenosyl-l-methionine hydroxide adenosyltransferase family protein [Flavobacteriales bacterium]